MCCLDDRVLLQALSHGSTISFRDNHSCSCWCFCREQKATKVNGTRFDDKAGTAKCVFYSNRSWMPAGMTENAMGERWTSPPQLPESNTGQNSSVEWLPSPTPPSPSPLHPSAFALHLGLGAMTGPSIISTNWSAADYNCCELFRLCWICSLNGKEPKRQRCGRSNKLHVTHVKNRLGLK